MGTRLTFAWRLLCLFSLALAVGVPADEVSGAGRCGDLTSPANQTSTQAGDGGWVLRFASEPAPGEQLPGAPAHVLIDERSDRAYVATREGQISAFDRRTQQQLASTTIPYTVESMAIDAEGGRLLLGVARYPDQSAHLAILSLPDLALAKTVPLASAAVPRTVLFDPQRGRLYALLARAQPSQFTGEIVVSDRDGEIIDQPWQLGSNALNAALDPATGRVLVLIPDYAGQSATVRAYAPGGQTVGEAHLPIQALRLLVDATRRRIYAVAAGDPFAGALATIHADSLSVLGIIPVSRQPYGMALDPRSGFLWLAAMRAAAPDFAPVLEVVDPAVGRTVTLVNYDRPVVSISTAALAADGEVRRLWVANQDNSLSIIDLDTHQPVGTIITGELIDDVGVDETTGRVFVLSGNADALYAVEPTGGGIVGKIPLKRQPTSMRIDQQTGRVYVLNRTDRSLSIVDGRALQPLAEVHLATVPGDKSWDVDPALGRAYFFHSREVVALALDGGQEVGRATVEAISTAGAGLTVDTDTHRVYVTGYASAILDGQTMASLGQLPGLPLTLTIDRASRRAYAVNWCTVKSCGIRTYVYDLRDNSLLAQLEGVGEVTALNPALGHLYFPASPAFVVDAYSFAKMPTQWRATDVAADARRGRIYLLDASNRLLRAMPDGFPRSDPALRQLYSAKIEIVWPHNGAPVTEANLANVGATIFEPATTRPIGADFTGRVQLWRAIDNEPAAPLAEGVKRLAAWPSGQQQSCSGQGYPVWEFNDVDVSAARNPERRIFFYLTVDGLAVATNFWGHAADARTYFPYQDRPEGTAPVGGAVDTRIQIVWPHDGAGHGVPVSEANLANIGVFLYNHGTRTSVPGDWNPTVLLYRALNDGVEQLVGVGRKEIVEEGGRSWPRWVFDGVDVSAARNPANRYYFRAVVEGMPTYASVWSHGVDGRTFFPQQDIPVSGCR